AIAARPDREISVDLVRDGQALTRTVKPVMIKQGRLEVGDIGVLPNVHPHLVAISPDEPGARAGLKAGDVILAADGKPVTFQSEFRSAIAKNADKPLTLTILRDGSKQDVVVTPRKNNGVGYLGITPDD